MVAPLWGRSNSTRADDKAPESIHIFMKSSTNTNMIYADPRAALHR